MIIPIGVDCGMAEFVRKYNLRNISFPFDWTVSYNGVSKCIDDGFKFFTEPLNNRINKYGVSFPHDFENNNLLYQDREKYIRRCNRLINILETSNEEIIFCRKGHAYHHHNEHNGKYSNINNDIDDVEKLDLILQNKYPQLKYKIIVILVCGKCFNSIETYKSNSDRIEIYNIATPQVDDPLFENLCRKIFKV
tara:strand:- start:99 stop:677 length:579 start_codon:yes stop_codon:yes gene_type:complete